MSGLRSRQKKPLNISVFRESLESRGSGTRTHGLHVPNVARYQLRYTPELAGKATKSYTFFALPARKSNIDQ